MRKVFGYILIVFASLLVLSLLMQIGDVIVSFAVLINADAADLDGYRSGYFLGQIFGFFLMLGLAIGCFIWGKKLIKNKPKNKAIDELLQNS